MNSSKVYTRVNRVHEQVCEQAKDVSVSDIHEAMGALSRTGLMSPRMRPLNRGLRIAGPAITAFCASGDNLMMHRALYFAQAGDVLVVVCPAETSGAQWGDVAGQYALYKKLAGVIVHGCIRDTDVLEQLRFPIWSTLISPARPNKGGHGLVNAPVSCDGAIVRPGDLVVADGDGVVVVPREDSAAVVAAARLRMEKENEVASAIRGGAHPWKLTGSAASYAAMGIEEIDTCWDGSK